MGFVLTHCSFSLASLRKFISVFNHRLSKSKNVSTSRANSKHFHSSKLHAGRVVLISTSDVIFDSLALEEWLYEKRDLKTTEYLFMWKNRPAIVSGRHQNPWLEANIPFATSLGLDIARR